MHACISPAYLPRIVMNNHDVRLTSIVPHPYVRSRYPPLALSLLLLALFTRLPLLGSFSGLRPPCFLSNVQGDARLQSSAQPMFISVLALSLCTCNITIYHIKYYSPRDVRAPSRVPIFVPADNEDGYSCDCVLLLQCPA